MSGGGVGVGGTFLPIGQTALHLLSKAEATCKDSVCVCEKENERKKVMVVHLSLIFRAPWELRVRSWIICCCGPHLYQGIPTWWAWQWGRYTSGPVMRRYGKYLLPLGLMWPYAQEAILSPSEPWICICSSWMECSLEPHPTQPLQKPSTLRRDIVVNAPGPPYPHLNHSQTKAGFTEPITQTLG